MLPASSRLTVAADFRATTRRGVRAARPTLVVHARLLDQSPPSSQDSSPETCAPRVGFVVSKAVGNAVTRNRVKRRLRHLVAPLLTSFPQDVHMVVRALPAAATDPGRLEPDLHGAVRSVLQRLTPERRDPA
ncbi:ribonuclease P protein component [Tessaracoccus sp. SD287]|uniref:ribonuclease P protein component n=1 Tax=Tessaracoccus sp. SD287 TaxID=2782008 RepID=UPI001A9655B4|nr:ribonuclease P protein component [Tessaracoccus sp. SD287]MBO1031908.1 ribonuclease P protein component [Tessaracoccus sp. SD287]